MTGHRKRRNSRNREIRLAIKLQRAEFRKADYGSYNFDSKYGNGRINDNCSSYVDRHRGDFHTSTRYSKQILVSRGAVNFDVSWLKPSWSKSRTLTENHAHQLRYPSAPFQRLDSYSETYDVAMRALFTKIRKDAPGWDILSDAVELPETLSSIREAAIWFGNLISDVKNRRLRKVMKRLNVARTRGNMRRFHQILLYGNKHPVTIGDSMSNLWMNYRYALMPMVYSAQDAFKTFCSSVYNGQENYCFTAQVTIPYEYFNDTVTSYSREPLMYNVHFMETEKSSIRLKAYFNYSASLLTRLNLNSWHGLAAAAWEKVKFSWMVDWFISIGEYLQNLNVPDLVPGIMVQETIKGMSSDDLFITDVNYYDGTAAQTLKFMSVSGKNRSFLFSRTPRSLSIPDVEINLPSTWFNTKREIDSSALLWQKLRSGLGGYLENSSYKIHR